MAPGLRFPTITTGFSAIALAALVSACGDGSTTTVAPLHTPTPGSTHLATPTATPTPSPSPSVTPALVASPSSLEYVAAGPYIPSPQPIQLISNLTIGPGFTISVGDPVQTGASLPLQTGPTTGMFFIYPISIGQRPSSPPAGTVVTATDSLGAAADITVKQDICGRPDNLLPNSLLVFPVAGSSGVPPTIGKLYFAVFTQVQPYDVNLHLILGQHGTLEGSPLQSATPPPGSTMVTPRPGETLTYMAGAIPVLQSGAQYWTQIYDDTCQLPILPGGFST